MDYFKIFTIILLIIILCKLYLLELKDIERFNNAEQSIGGVDDANSINTLAQLARKLIDGGATVPGNMTIKGDTAVTGGMTVTGAIKSGDITSGAITSAAITASGDITTSGAIKIKNKWMLGGSGGTSGDDDWVRMTGLDNKAYYGGFAAGKLWTADNTINGRNIFAELDDIKANMVRYGGIVRHRRVPDNRWVRGDNTSDWDSSYSDWRILRQ